MPSANEAMQRSEITLWLNLGSPRQRVLMLILISAAIRITFAASLDLGVDESYLVATGRQFVWSTYDHPPMAWWIGWAITHLTGSESAFVVRLPFILLFVATTWQIYRLGQFLFHDDAGFWAALALNCAPVLGVTSATWAVPDAPLMLALVSGALSLAHVLFNKNASPILWLSAGFWGGVALLSKYHGAFLFIGALIFLISCLPYRHWLISPWPYLGTALAVLMFSPVLIWNEQHEWVSFVFQTSRGTVTHWLLWMPFITLAGQALFLFPPLWIALVATAYRAARIGPRDARTWFMFCLGIGPVALFTLSSAWSQSVLFHWAAPGYLMWLPLLGERLAAWQMTFNALKTKLLTFCVCMTPVLVLSVNTLAAAPINWVSLIGRDPFGEIWNSDEMRDEFTKRGLLTPDIAFMAGLKWHQTARLDYAFHGAVPFTCLCDDARQYGVIAPAENFKGKTGIVIVPEDKSGLVEKFLTQKFYRLDKLDNFAMHRNGATVGIFSIYRGTDLLP